MRKKLLWLGLAVFSGALLSTSWFEPEHFKVAKAAVPVIQTSSPAAPGCVNRSAPDLAGRLLVLTGTDFSITQYNLQFRKVATGETSIHFHSEISWESTTRLSVDANLIKGLLWNDFKELLTARLTQYVKATDSYQPVSDWSPNFYLADDALTCTLAAAANPPTSRPVNVYVMNFDPLLNGQPLHTYSSNWNNPNNLNPLFSSDIKQSSGGLINYQIVRQADIAKYPPKPGGYVFSSIEYQNCLNSNGTSSPRCKDLIDINAVLNTRYDPGYVSACEALGTGGIDEIWLWGGPWMGYLEVYMFGPETVCTGVNKNFAVMGFNYERGPGEMIHDMGHRAEGALQVGIGLTTWDSFDGQRLRYINPTLPDVDANNAHCGNVHFPPNAKNAYDYSRNRVVQSDCDDWANYPNLTGQKKLVNDINWCAIPATDDCQRGFMNWWLSRLPRKLGWYNDTHLNWWQYIFPLPRPVITSLNPSSVTAGADLTLTFDGLDFVEGLVVGWNGKAFPTTFVNRNKVTAVIPAAQVTAGVATVALFASSPGGGLSNIQSLTIVPPVPVAPSAPSNLLTSTISSQINLTWNDNASNEDGFKLERKLGAAGSWSEIKSFGPNTKIYQDSGLTSGTTYCYRVRSYNLIGYSAYSNETCAKTADPASPLIVTNPEDDAQALTVGTLSYALKQATSGQTITFALTSGTTVAVKGKLPALAAGVSLKGNCGPAGPAISIDGTTTGPNVDGLTLSGNNILEGLKINHFSGEQIRAKGNGNRFSCMVTTK